MANSFLNKVSAERRVLYVINTRFRGDKQLAGLSKSAIDLWHRKVGAQTTDQVTKSLFVLADLCQCLSDRSHESFGPLNPDVEEQLENQLNTLNSAVQELSL